MSLLNNKLAVLVMGFLFVCPLSGLWASRDLSIIPFHYDKKISSEEFRAIYNSLYLVVSSQKEYDVVSNFITKRKLGGFDNKVKFPSTNEAAHAMAAGFSKKTGTNFIMFGRLSVLKEFNLRNIILRRISLKVYLVDVKAKTIINQLDYEHSVLYYRTKKPTHVQLGDLGRFGRQMGMKVLWKGAGIFPVNVSIKTKRKYKDTSKMRKQLKQRIRNYVGSLKLPRGVEADSVDVSIIEKKNVAPTGVVGCVTLVGWIFLPYWKVDYKMKTTFRFRLRNQKSVKYVQIFEAGKSDKYFHLLTSAKNIGKPNLKLFRTLHNKVERKVRLEAALHKKRDAYFKQVKPRKKDPVMTFPKKKKKK